MALDRENKLASYATHDALESLPKIIKFLEAISAENEKKLWILIQEKTGKDLSKEIKNSKFLFQKAKKDIETTCKAFTDSNKTTIDVTEENVAKLFYEITDAVLGYLKLELGENKNKDKLFEYLMTDIFIQYASFTYKLADERNKASFFSRIKKMAFLNEHDFLKPYALLENSTRYVLMTAETVELWEEIELWLEAQYMFRHNLMPKDVKDDVQVDEHGKYMPVATDEDDLSFKKNKGICKYDIELRNFTISKMLRVSIDKYRNTLAQQPTSALKLETIQTVKTSEPPDEISLSTPQSNKDTVEDFEFIPLTPISQTQLKPRSSNNISFIESEGSTQIIITLNRHELEKISQITAAAKAILEHDLLVVGDDVIPKEFANVEKNKQATDDDRITKLRFCAKKYLLTSLQNAALEYLSDDIESSFKQYKNEKSSFIFSRKHASLVDKFLLKLPTMSPQVQLLKLIKLRKKLADDSSDRLLDRVDKLLLKAYRTLSINHALSLQEDVVVTHRKKSHSHHQ